MQLLDSEQLEYAFSVHGISRENEARRFYTDLWALIQRGEKARTPLDLSKVQTDVRHLCAAYFHVMHQWQCGEADNRDDGDECTISRDNAREAKAVLPSFEKQFTRYALCYLELNRALIQIRASLADIARDYNVNDMSKHLKITNATGALLQRAHRERKILMEKRLRMERVRTLLQHFDPLMELLGADLPRLMGQGQGDHELTIFKGALRKRNFAQARAIVARWPQDWLKDTGHTVLAMAQQHADELQAQDSLMLHSSELALITMFLNGDESRINQFMAKYNIPYMVFKYRNLIRQGYLLGRIGSIEALIIQHAKLLSVAVRPQSDSELAKAQEQAVLVPARALQGRFKSLGAIFDEMETTLAILEKLFVQTRDYMAHAPENIQN